MRWIVADSNHSGGGPGSDVAGLIVGNGSVVGLILELAVLGWCWSGWLWQIDSRCSQAISPRTLRVVRRRNLMRRGACGG